MTDAEAIEILARWVVTLRMECEVLRGQDFRQRQILVRRSDRIRHLEKLIEQLGNPMYRFWMDAYAPEQVAQLARELDEAVA